MTDLDNNMRAGHARPLRAHGGAGQAHCRGEARLARRGALAALFLCLSQAHAQPSLRLTLAEARRLAIQNNPRLMAAKYTAAAAYEVPKQYRASFEPTVFGSLTGVGADNGSRLAAGGLNNPVVYDRL